MAALQDRLAAAPGKKPYTDGEGVNVIIISAIARPLCDKGLPYRPPIALVRSDLPPP